MDGFGRNIWGRGVREEVECLEVGGIGEVSVVCVGGEGEVGVGCVGYGEVGDEVVEVVVVG